MDNARSPLAGPLGRAIRQRRLASGLSQEVFAESCAMHRTYVGSVERGERNLSLASMDRISRALDLPLSQLIADAETLLETDGGGSVNSHLVERLLSQMDALTDPQLVLLSRVASAMLQPVEKTINSASDILTPGVEVAIANQLVLHHATHESKLNKKAFEYVFKSACEADGQDARIDHNPTHPGADVIVNGIAYSLKTQASKGARVGSVNIQKLMEARWIRDSAGPQLARVAKSRIEEHLGDYERILLLQALDTPDQRVRYRLIEIPKCVLMLAARFDDGALEPKNRFGSSGVNLSDDRGQVFRLLLDGSVEKVRVFSLRVDRCQLHGEWFIPITIP